MFLGGQLNQVQAILANSNLVNSENSLGRIISISLGKTSAFGSEIKN